MLRKPKLSARRDAPRSFRLASSVAIRAAEGEGQPLATFEGNAYTGAPMRPMGWWNDVIIDLDGVEIPSQHRPALRQHDHEQIVGHTTEVTVGKEGVAIKGVFSGQPEHADKVTVPARNGFQWQLSVGADPIRTEFLESGEEATVNGRTITGPMTISRQTRLEEISFVPLGADGDTSVSVAASRGNTMTHWHLALKELCAELRAAGSKCHTDAEIDNMTGDEARSALKKAMKDARARSGDSADDDDEDEDDDEGDDKGKKNKSGKRPGLNAQAKQVLAELRQSITADLTRGREISALCRRHKVGEVEITAGGTTRKVDLAEHAIAEEWSLDQVKGFLLDHVRAERPSMHVGVPGGHVYSTSTPEVNEAVLEAAVLQAARHQFRLEDDDFYFEEMGPDKKKIRRVSERLQRETQRDFRARYTDQIQQTAHTLFRGRIGLKQLFGTCFRANGARHELDLSGEAGCRSMLAAWDHMERTRIEAEGASNLAIGNILANVLNKFALQGYLFVEQAWREIFAIRPVNDFKPTKSINLLGDVMFKVLGPTGELANADIADQAFSNQAQPFGRILTIPWVHLVNDDLSMLTSVPMKLGQGAGLALNDNVWSLWAAASRATTVNGISAPNGDDGVSFWRTSTGSTKHKKYQPNKATGAGTALSTTSLAQAKALFDNQIDPDGNPLGFDGTMPRLLHGPTLWQTVMQLLYGNTLITTALGSTSAQAVAPDKNVWAGMMKPVMSRYLENSNYGNSTVNWFVTFDPAALPVAEVAFLHGVDTPAVLQASPDYQFDRLGVSIRGTMPFGSNVQNFRGGVFMAGS